MCCAAATAPYIVLARRAPLLLFPPQRVLPTPWCGCTLRLDSEPRAWCAIGTAATLLAILAVVVDLTTDESLPWNSHSVYGHPDNGVPCHYNRSGDTMAATTTPVIQSKSICGQHWCCVGFRHLHLDTTWSTRPLGAYPHLYTLSDVSEVEYPAKVHHRTTQHPTVLSTSPPVLTVTLCLGLDQGTCSTLPHTCVCGPRALEYLLR